MAPHRHHTHLALAPRPCPSELQTSASSLYFLSCIQAILHLTRTYLQVAILFPPAAAAFITGCSCDLLINICLTMYVSFIPHNSRLIETEPIHSLGYLPGHIVRLSYNALLLL